MDYIKYLEEAKERMEADYKKKYNSTETSTFYPAILGGIAILSIIGIIFYKLSKTKDKKQ